MGRKWAQGLPLVRLHEQQQWLRWAGKKFSREAIEFIIMYSRVLDGLGDLELPAQGMQTLQQRLQEKY